MNVTLPDHAPSMVASGCSSGHDIQADSYPRSDFHGEEIMGFRKITFRTDKMQEAGIASQDPNKHQNKLSQGPFSHGVNFQRQSHSASPQVSFIQPSSASRVNDDSQPYNVSTIVSSKSSLPNFHYDKSREGGNSQEEKRFGLSQPSIPTDNDVDIKTPTSQPMDQPYNMNSISSLPNITAQSNYINSRKNQEESSSIARSQSAPASTKEKGSLCEIEKFISQNWTVLLDQKPGMPGFLTSFLFVEISKRQMKDDAEKGFGMLNSICSQLYEPNQSYLFFCSSLSLYQYMIYDIDLIGKSKKFLQASFDKMIAVYIRVYSQTLTYLLNSTNNSPDYIYYFNKIKGTIPRFSGDSGKYATHEIDNNIDCFLVNDFLKKQNHDRIDLVLEKCRKVKQIFSQLHFEMRRYSELISIISNYKKVLLAPSMIPAIAPMFPPKAVAVCFNQFKYDISPSDIDLLANKLNIKEQLTPVADFFFPEFHEFPKECSEFVFC